MIGKDRMLRRVCRNYKQVENYERAVADEENKWHLHHRREIDEMKSRQQLIDEGRYYDVVPEELIFLTRKEHNRIHNENLREETREKRSEAASRRLLSEESRKKMSDSRTGEKNGMFGKKHSEETRKKLSEARSRRPPVSEETRKKMSENNARTMLGKKHSEETKTKMSKALKGMFCGRIWWNNGVVSKLCKEQPGPDFVRGRLHIK